MLYDWYRNFIVQDSACVEKNRGNSDELTNEEDEVQNGEREKSAGAGSVWERYAWSFTVAARYHGPYCLPFEKLNPTFHVSTPRGGASVSCSTTAL